MLVSAAHFELSRKSGRARGGRICPSPSPNGRGLTIAESNVIDSELTNLTRLRGNGFFQKFYNEEATKVICSWVTESKSWNTHFKRVGGVIANRKPGLDHSKTVATGQSQKLLEVDSLDLVT